MSPRSTEAVKCEQAAVQVAVLKRRLRDVARRERRAVLGVLSYWLAPTTEEGARV